MKTISNYDLPFIKEKLFLMNQEVLVIKEYFQFGLCKVRYIDENECFIISESVLSKIPINELSININTLGGMVHDS